MDDLSWDQQIYQSHESVMDTSTIEHRDICSSLKQSPASLPRKKSRVPKQGKVFFPSATIFLGVNLLLVSGSLKEGIYIYIIGMVILPRSFCGPFLRLTMFPGFSLAVTVVLGRTSTALEALLLCSCSVLQACSKVGMTQVAKRSSLLEKMKCRMEKMCDANKNTETW